MADPVLATFQKATFRGVDFLFISQSQTAGRKNKIFEYPNLDTRTITDLGKLQKHYSFLAKISDNNSTYLTSKQELIDALEEAGSGQLNHPTDGIKTVFCPRYTLNENIDDIGTATFNIEFYVVGEQSFPTQTSSFASNILNELNSFISNANSNFNSIWVANGNYIGNIEYSANLTQNLVDQFFNAPNLVSNDLATIDSYTTNVEALEANRFKYATDADSMSTSMSTIFDESANLGETSTDSLTIVNSFFLYDYGDPVSVTTFPTEERERNRQMINQYVNSYALSYYYFVLSTINLDTEAEILAQIEIIEAQYDFIMNNNIFSDVLNQQSVILNSDVITNIENLRVFLTKYLQGLLANSQKIISIYVNNASLIRVVYDYYGDLDLYQTIFDLNDLASSENITGTLEILSNAD